MLAPVWRSHELHQNIDSGFSMKMIIIIKYHMRYNEINQLVLTGGGRLIKRITKPAMMRKASRHMTIALNQMGNKLLYDSDITNAPTNILSAIGSRNEPNLLA